VMSILQSRLTFLTRLWLRRKSCSHVFALKDSCGNVENGAFQMKCNLTAIFLTYQKIVEKAVHVFLHWRIAAEMSRTVSFKWNETL